MTNRLWFLLSLLCIAVGQCQGCASEPTQLQDGPGAGAPLGYYTYCTRVKDQDPVCTWLKR